MELFADEALVCFDFIAPFTYHFVSVCCFKERNIYIYILCSHFIL